MKIKQLPDDFYVEEASDFVPGAAGPFGFYRLEKRGWSTPDALVPLRRRWRVEPRRISFGGLKDRHAWTVQYFTILHGPSRNFHHQEITVTHLGWADEPYTSRAIRCNRFRLTLRDLSADAAAGAQAELNRLAVEGLPNYFDDQRFGSVAGEGEEFIARLLVRGRFEEALRLALTGPYEFDRGQEKREKKLVRDHWGDWKGLAARLRPGHARRLVDYLRSHPADFRGAVAGLRPELRGLYLSAYQSHLWNRMLARRLTTTLPPDQLRPVTLRMGEVPFPVGLVAERQAELTALHLPLPSSRLKLEPGDPCAELVRSVLAEEQLALHDLQVRGVREMFFSKGDRAALCMPAQLTHEAAADELHRGRLKLTLAFELPRGCYATLLVKAATADSPVAVR